MPSEAILAEHGGGCHQALGAAVTGRPYRSCDRAFARDEESGGETRWELETERAGLPPRARRSDVAEPRRDDELNAAFHRRSSVRPPDAPDFGYARAEPCRRTGRRLRERDRLGRRRADVAAAGGAWRLGPRLRGQPWRRSGPTSMRWPAASSVAAADAPGCRRPGALATYGSTTTCRRTCATRSHFFWTSGNAVQARARSLAGRSTARGTHPARARTARDDSLRSGSHALAAACGWTVTSWERDVCL